VGSISVVAPLTKMTKWNRTDYRRRWGFKFSHRAGIWRRIDWYL